jgi:hypothetical protein
LLQKFSAYKIPRLSPPLIPVTRPKLRSVLPVVHPKLNANHAKYAKIAFSFRVVAFFAVNFGFLPLLFSFRGEFFRSQPDIFSFLVEFRRV